MKYNNHLNYKKRKRFIVKVRIFVALLLVAILGGFAYFYFNYFQTEDVNTPEMTTSSPTSSTVGSTINIFRTPYFQFQANKNWVEVTNESNDDKFVYRSLRANLIEHEMTIYTRLIPANLSANRVFPVTLTNNNTELVPLGVSEHCVKSNNNQSSINNIPLKVSGVDMLCDSDSTNYTVLAGEDGGSTVLNLIRPDGTLMAYSIYYVNLKAIPDASELEQILASFQSR